MTERLLSKSVLPALSLWPSGHTRGQADHIMQPLISTADAALNTTETKRLRELSRSVGRCGILIQTLTRRTKGLCQDVDITAAVSLELLGGEKLIHYPGN